MLLLKHADLKERLRWWQEIISEPLTPQKSSYIIAAVDRVVHHSVILDMSGVESFRVQEAREERSQEPDVPELLQQGAQA